MPVTMPVVIAPVFAADAKSWPLDDDVAAEAGVAAELVLAALDLLGPLRV